MAHMVRRKRPLRVWLAMLVGGLVGLWMIAQLRVEVPDLPPPPAPKRAAAEPPLAAVARPETPPVGVPRARPSPDPARPSALEPATLEVEVVDGSGRAAPDAALRATCQVSPSETNGSTHRFTARPGTCELVASRRDGALLARSEPVTLELAPGERGFARLELPAQRTGGIGIQFRPDPDGMRVIKVVPDSPADRAGLQAGDLVVGVGGQKVAGMSSDDFVRAMTGPEGSRVEFELAYDEDGDQVTERITVERAYLSG